MGFWLFRMGALWLARMKSSTTAALSSSLALEARRFAGFANLRIFGIVDHRFFALRSLCSLTAFSFSNSFSSSFSILPPMRSNVFLRVKGGACIGPGDSGTGDSARASRVKTPPCAPIVVSWSICSLTKISGLSPDILREKFAQLLLSLELRDEAIFVFDRLREWYVAKDMGRGLPSNHGFSIASKLSRVESYESVRGDCINCAGCAGGAAHVWGCTRRMPPGSPLLSDELLGAEDKVGFARRLGLLSCRDIGRDWRACCLRVFDRAAHSGDEEYEAIDCISSGLYEGGIQSAVSARLTSKDFSSLLTFGSGSLSTTSAESKDAGKIRFGFFHCFCGTTGEMSYSLVT